ncbi:hypothetical protein RhiirB3_526000 [Rhizophagus irregularis]|nr:hypothetical protein RhiirB3_526000 [Rhizophagus irregularis]
MRLTNQGNLKCVLSINVTEQSSPSTDQPLLSSQTERTPLSNQIKYQSNLSSNNNSSIQPLTYEEATNGKVIIAIQEEYIQNIEIIKYLNRRYLLNKFNHFYDFLKESIQPPTYEEATSGKSYCRRKHLHDNVSSAIAFNTKMYSKYRNNQIYWEKLNRA